MACDVKLNSPRNETLTAVWINANYKKYQYFVQQKAQKFSVNKNVTKIIKFLKLISGTAADTVQREYYLVLEEKIKRTWNQASKLCEEFVDGYLPWFEGTDRLYELLSLFKLSKEIPAIEAIYIGLRFNAVKVSKHFAIGQGYLMYI